MRDQFLQILHGLQESWYQIAAFVPRLVVGAVLLILGWLLARALERLAVRVLRMARIDVAAERSGLDDFLLRGGVRFTIVTLLGKALYWGVLLVISFVVFNVLGLTMGPALLDRLTTFLPDLVAALLVMAFGSLGARFIRGMAEAYLNNIGIAGGDTIALLVQGALMIFVGVLALEQLGINTALLVSAFQLAFGAFCLAMALAFGLGGRKWAEAILERTRSKR